MREFARSGWKVAGLVLGGFLALAVALLAFANAAANHGLIVRPLALLGPPFVPADALARREAEMFLAARQQSLMAADARASRVQSPSAAALRTAALDVLDRKSFDSLGPTFGALALEAAGQEAGARRLLNRSAALSRRNNLARYEMMQLAIRDGDIDGMLRHLDIFLRSVANPPADLFLQFVPLLSLPDGRQAMVKLVRSNPNWLTALFETLVASSPQVAPVARLMLSVGKPLADGQRERQVYASLVAKLADQGAADELRELYPRLPGSTPALLNEVTPRAEQRPTDYPPVVWSMLDSADLGGNVLAGDGGKGDPYLQLFASPGHEGVVASKILFGHLGQTLLARAESDGQASAAQANIVISCLTGAASPVRSTDLVSHARTRVVLPLPSHCGAVRIDVVMKGGVGREDAQLSLKDISVN